MGLMDSEQSKPQSWLDRSPVGFLPRLSFETFIVIIVIALAVFSRFYNVDLRVMSHDETNHVVPSYDLFTGKGYRHDPVTHGPMQFHLVALSYFVLGDSDFSSRVPSVVFSIATVIFVLLAYRRYLGRSGTLIAGILFLISPYMLFYGRYTRNESFVALFGVILLYATLRYLDRGDKLSLYLITGALVFHFITKETSFIYTAQFLLFLGVLFLDDVVRFPRVDPRWRDRFVLVMVLALLLLGLALGFGVWDAALHGKDVATTAALTAPAVAAPLSIQHIGTLAAFAGALLMGVLAIVMLVRQLGWKALRSLRTFDLLILTIALILPQLTAFPIKMVGWNPLDYQTTGLLRTGGFLIIFFAISIALGLWWNPQIFVGCAILFYAVFTVFYTTFFTNGLGFFTGIVGSLGYWLSQQGVSRGSQPWYFYTLVQIPMYEFLPALGTMVAVFFGVRHKLFSTNPDYSPAEQPQEASVPVIESESYNVMEPSAVIMEGSTEGLEVANVLEPLPVKPRKVPVLFLMVFWGITSLIAFSVAGEKMPWLTVHITLPLLLAAGFGLGYLVDTTDWRKLLNREGALALVVLPVFLAALGGVLGNLLGSTPPFQGKTIDQLQATSSFLLALVALVASGVGLNYLLRNWRMHQLVRLFTAAVFVVLAMLTVRASILSSYINYDTAKEFLVYAHAARGPKDVLAQIEEISRRTTRGKDIVVAYDNDGLYPYWWYLRDYPKKIWFTDKPTRDLRNAAVIISGETNYAKLEPIVKGYFTEFDYMRLWWPMQDYFNLTPDRIWGALKTSGMRDALFQIWLNRDYTEYAKVTNSSSLTLENWQPSSRMRMYVRNDIVAQIWNYGASPTTVATTQKDPYEGKLVKLVADTSFGVAGSNPGELQAPRGIAVGPDGSIYVADSRNNRIEHFSTDGTLLQAWGTFKDAAKGAAEGGTFNEPWGVAVGPDGSVYVTDTWNHRVQHFSAEGQFINMWGYFGQGEKPEAFWGPRGIAVDAQGRVYVADTGNKRIAIFSADGQGLNQFGTAGMDVGQFDEPVGVAVGPDGSVYVTDTWNQRVQVFALDTTGKTYLPVRQWSISGWYGQSLDNKPFIVVDKTGNVFVSDPEGYRILEFNATGEIVRTWGEYSAGADGFGLTSGVALDSEGRLWVSDPGNNRLLRFTLPQ